MIRRWSEGTDNETRAHNPHGAILAALFDDEETSEPMPGLEGADPLAPASLSRPDGAEPSTLGPAGTA